MNKWKWVLYVSAALFIIIPISVVLISDHSTFSSAFSHTVISIAILLVILGKVVTILEKRKGNRSFVPDVGAVIGLSMVLVFSLI
ncbi:histidine kinase [Halalkalibacter sp. APA_J-10(15)]|uniref:histidine kinase n=1 Tax=Halalkalibacter sp. APA_J-10(15) TaxID=2933805 RepID=UPI001FF6AF1E|nr:histidine kinase [Halalkalibacter sp. APA_J-10(15)]MCK0470543.1 histidine kinase [Halalkalibacter sp. APA_J-10(15)]